MDPISYKHTVHKTTEGGVPSPHNYALSGKIMLSAIIVLFSIVLFILFLHFYVRWHVLRRATRRATRRNRRLHFAGEDQSPSATRAMDPAILNSLPVLLFSAVPGETEECDCAVCLTEFEDGQKIRNLPPCGHCFHVDCIDMWFASHSNCPLCRAAVEALPSDSCVEGEEVGSTSSDSGEGEFAVEGLGGEGERVGIGRALKWPIKRIVLLRRFLGLSGAVLDLEEGGGHGAAPPPPAM